MSADDRAGDTLLDITRQAEREGYSAQLVARDTDAVECQSCKTASAPGDFDVAQHRRVEGTSDAADMLLVAMTTCPACGARGVLVLGYGPNANTVDAAILGELDLASSRAGDQPDL